jgi:hypothetical protein
MPRMPARCARLGTVRVAAGPEIDPEHDILHPVDEAEEYLALNAR